MANKEAEILQFNNEIFDIVDKQARSQLNNIANEVNKLKENQGTGGGVMSSDVATLLLDILSEGIYGTNQASNIALLKSKLINIELVSISTVLNTQRVIVGTNYSDLDITVIANYSDGTQVEVNDYSITEGTVQTGENTITITFEDKTTSLTFTGIEVQTYSITYDLTNATSSSDVAIVEENGYYSTSITLTNEAELNQIQITMGGVDITDDVYNGGNILIESVTGDVIITVVGVIPKVIDMFSTGIQTTFIKDADTDSNLSGNVINRHVSAGLFSQDTIVTITINNPTESDVDLSRLYIGQYPYIIPGNTLYISDVVKFASSTLKAGDSYTITYTVKANNYLLTAYQSNITGLTDCIITVKGNATLISPVTGMTKLTRGSSIYGVWNCSADDGTTPTQEYGNTTLYSYTPALENGVYDAYDYNNSDESVSVHERKLGVSSAPSSKTAYYYSVSNGYSSNRELKYLGQITSFDDKTTLVGTPNSLYIKKVN